MKHKYNKYFANIANIIFYIMFKFQILKSYLKKFITINYYYSITRKQNENSKIFQRDLLRILFKNQNIIFVIYYTNNQILLSKISHLFLIMLKNITIYF